MRISSKFQVLSWKTLAIFTCAWLTTPALQAQSQPLEKTWEYETRGLLPQALLVDSKDHRHFYVAAKSGGLLILQSNENTPPRELAKIPIDQLNNLDVMHLTQRGELLYLALGDLFAANGAPAGLAIVNITQRAAPKILGIWTSPKKLNGSAAIVVDDKFAYLGGMSEGVMILDITTPAKIRLVTTFQPDVDFPRVKPTKVQHPNARGLALVGERLYVAYDAGGLRVLDISNRNKPREVSRYVNTGMGQKQQAYNNLVVKGGTIYAAIDYAGLEILSYDGSNTIKQVGWWNPWKAETLANVWFNSAGHTNQLALDSKKKRIYLSAGDSELQVVDVSEPAKPNLVGHYGEPKNGRGAWGVTVAEDRALLTYIQAVVPFRGTWSGIVAVKIP